VSLGVVLLLALLPNTSLRGQATSGPPVLDIPESAMDRPLQPGDIAKIAAYTGYWTDRLAAAASQDEILRAQQGVVEGYKLFASPYYQTEYARALSGKLLGLLNVEGKQLAAASVAAQMQSYTIQPALEAMLASNNAGVRYWGARGYRNAGKSIMTQGGNALNTMLNSLQKIGANDSCGIIVGATFRALLPDPAIKGPSAVAARAALDKIWMAHLPDLQIAQPDFVEAYDEMVKLLARNEPDEAALALQLLDDVLETATQALTLSENQTDPAAKALSDLVEGAETRLMAMVGKSGVGPVTAIIRDAKVARDVAFTRARLEVVNTWRPLLAAKGVKVRTPPPPATSPASAPAATPS
jgi:hypothetical protein